MKKIKDFFIRFWRLINNKEIRLSNIENKNSDQISFESYSPLAYDPNEVIKALESYKNPKVMLNDCKKYGVKNDPNQNLFSNNKTEQAIKEQLYNLLYQYEWQGSNDKYYSLIDNRIQMFKDIIEYKENQRIEYLISKDLLCPNCKRGELEKKYTGLVEITSDNITGGPIGAGIHVSGTGTTEYQFHYKKCKECDYSEMYEYRKTPSWWDDLWNLDCPFTSGNIIEKYQNNELNGKKYKSHKITRW